MTRYSIKNDRESHTCMTPDPAGDWVLYSDTKTRHGKLPQPEPNPAPCPMPALPPWEDFGDGGVKATHDQGDYTGAIVTNTQVVKGGNGKWTPGLLQVAKGRLKKLGAGRVSGKFVFGYFPGQVSTKEDAIALCEEQWKTLQ